MSRSSCSRSTSAMALLLAIASVALVDLPASTAHAQRVVVQPPGRRGGGVVVEPGRRRGDRGRRGAVVVQPGRRGSVVVQPGRRGGVVVQPGRRGGVVVEAPRVERGRSRVVFVGPRGVVRSAPPRVRVVAPPPPQRPRARWAPPSRHGDVWIQPYWGWTGSSWEWSEGHWEQPPQLGAIWIDPQFDGGAWVPGYWTTPQSSSAARYGQPYQVGTQLAGTFSTSDDRDWTGALYHDYVVQMSAGETATFILVGGPSPQQPGQRIDIALQVLSNGAVVATGSTQTGSDAQVTFTSPQPAVFVIRASSRGAGFGASYLLQSSAGQWMPQTSPYDDYWGGAGGYYEQPQYDQPQYDQPQYDQPQYEQPQYEQPAQAYPDCRRTLIEMGHPATNLMFCDGAEPNCAVALLGAGHAPSNLMFCQGVEPQCALSLLQSGRPPTELQFCR